MSLLTAKEIMEIIPHRYPFLLIDTIEELEAGSRAVGQKCVSMNEPYFQGHFPGNPVMPGALIVEAMAQTGAVAMLSVPQWKGKAAYFAGIDKAKFRRKLNGDSRGCIEIGGQGRQVQGSPGHQRGSGHCGRQGGGPGAAHIRNRGGVSRRAVYTA